MFPPAAGTSVCGGEKAFKKGRKGASGDKRHAPPRTLKRCGRRSRSSTCARRTGPPHAASHFSVLFLRATVSWTARTPGLRKGNQLPCGRTYLQWINGFRWGHGGPCSEGVNNRLFWGHCKLSAPVGAVWERAKVDRVLGVGGRVPVMVKPDRTPTSNRLEQIGTVEMPLISGWGVIALFGLDRLMDVAVPGTTRFSSIKDSHVRHFQHSIFLMTHRIANVKNAAR
uniref:Uncharacterized protein n=1 Tax=Steinernema glaseri TaxID=37863 RepID=A0A1I7YJS2_9BILA